MSKRMISRVSFLICFIIVFSCGITFTNAQGSQINIFLNGQKLTYNDSTGYPYYDSNGRMQVPLRATLEPLGATIYVDSDKNSVIVQKNSITIEVPFGKSFIYKNGVLILNDTVSTVKNNRTYLPIRIVLEALGYTLLFDSKTNTLRIEMSDISSSVNFWNYSKKVEENLYKALKRNFPNININFTQINDVNSAYQNKIIASFRAGSGFPDIFVAESSFIKKFINTDGLCENLDSAKYTASEITKNMIPYTVDVAKDNNGTLRGLTYMACPGGIGYKRDIAKKYLGTDNPDAIGEMLSSSANILNTGKKLFDASKGKAKLFAGADELFQAYKCSKSLPWTANNKLTIDSKMLEYLDLEKSLESNKYSGNIKSWTPAWDASIQDDTYMCYSIPTWGIEYILFSDREHKGSGRWSIAKAPYPYYWGGDWLCISANSNKKNTCWKMLKYLASDKDQLRQWAYNTGDFINNLELIEELKNNNSFFNSTLNQNFYETFEPLTKNINAKNITEFDDVLNENWLDYSYRYFNDKLTKERAIATFKNGLSIYLPNVKVE